MERLRTYSKSLLRGKLNVERSDSSEIIATWKRRNKYAKDGMRMRCLAETCFGLCGGGGSLAQSAIRLGGVELLEQPFRTLPGLGFSWRMSEIALLT